MDNNQTKGKFKVLVKELAEGSAFHGVSKIASSKSACIRILWILALACATGVAFFQLWKLIVLYSSSPISTKVTLEFKRLPFPAVSFCNLNIVKKSREGNMSEELRISGKKNAEEADTNETDWWDSYDYNIYDYNGSYYDYNLGESSYFQEGDDSNPKNKWIQETEDFKINYLSQSREMRKLQGHRIQDMLIHCSFSAMGCRPKHFKLFQSGDYGNCYTFQHDGATTTRPGPLYGLILTLNVEILEYLDYLTTNPGIKLVVHEPGTHPVPFDEGLTLSVSQQTNIGLKLINISRLGEPYGKCDDGIEFKKNYKITYTVTACMKICKYEAIKGMCKCRPIDVDLTLHDEGYSFCSEIIDKDKKCMREIEAIMNEDESYCNCERPCREVVYDKTLSAIDWPVYSYWEHALMRKLCRKNLSYTKDICAKIKENGIDSLTDDETDIYQNQNFLRVNVYFESLNFENVEEEPMYDEFRFMSDIGGTLGLFIGASLLSFFEIIQFVIEVLLFLYTRKKDLPKEANV